LEKSESKNSPIKSSIIPEISEPEDILDIHMKRIELELKQIDKQLLKKISSKLDIMDINASSLNLHTIESNLLFF